ncbi:hypothetical protein RND81_10G067300 [Saponaria officinalis]|uniref:Uncharacterized protein n=1 Tax=Saponaria officinalis TaxID=3572 RepID=A0AAW1HYT5_SAPOF
MTGKGGRWTVGQLYRVLAVLLSTSDRLVEDDVGRLGGGEYGAAISRDMVEMFRGGSYDVYRVLILAFY